MAQMSIFGGFLFYLRNRLLNNSAFRKSEEKVEIPISDFSWERTAEKQEQSGKASNSALFFFFFIPFSITFPPLTLCIKRVGGGKGKGKTGNRNAGRKSRTVNLPSWAMSGRVAEVDCCGGGQRRAPGAKPVERYEAGGGGAVSTARFRFRSRATGRRQGQVILSVKLELVAEAVPLRALAVGLACLGAKERAARRGGPCHVGQGGAT